MVDKDKGRSKKSDNPKKKFKANAMRRPTGVVISDEPSRGYSHLGRGSNIPSASASQCNSLNTGSGSIGLSNLHIESNGSEPNTPTTQHSDAHGPQPGDRDNFRRLVIEPLGYNLRPDVGMAKIILKCIGTHYNGVYPNWSSIPLNNQGQMFNEFKRSEIGKMARASEKGGSLHTGGAISQVTRKERMEKELGRPVAVPEMFKVTHVKKVRTPQKKKDGLSHVLKRHISLFKLQDRYIRISQEYRSTLPLESQDRPFTQEENENLWKQSAGESIRGSVYGYPEKAYQKKKSWYCGSSSSSFDGGDREIISAMESKITYLNAELAAVAEREKKREEEIVAAKEVENKKYAAFQAQLNFLFESGNILPPCPASSDGSDQEGDENDKESEGDEE
ncbi:hypothetical protein KY284_030614 [Solanum tuberosum]|nr:hypothetical protein KY284_030614 [Solanum tuberosum]